MERQTGLGRSLEDVLESLAPIESEPARAGRLLFEPEDLERQLEQLMGQIVALQERVHHLVALVPDDAVPRVVDEQPATTVETPTAAEAATPLAPEAGHDEKKTKKHKKKQEQEKKGKKKGKKAKAERRDRYAD